MSKFVERRKRVLIYEVKDKHVWSAFREASDNARGWSRIGYLIYCCERHIENIRAARVAYMRSRSTVDWLRLRDSRARLRSIIRFIQRMERGEFSALNGLPAQINPATVNSK